MESIIDYIYSRMLHESSEEIQGLPGYTKEACQLVQSDIKRYKDKSDKYEQEKLNS